MESGASRIILNILDYYHKSPVTHITMYKAHFHAVKCNLMELTTKSACVPLEVSGLDTYAHVSEFHMLVDCSLA